MSEESPKKSVNSQTGFSREIDSKAKLKLKAQQNHNPGLWYGLGKMGLIGWAVVVPTLLGAALGIWIDNHYPGTYSWTLMLLLIGLIIGCLNAWHWVTKEDKEMHEDKNKKDE